MSRVVLVTGVSRDIAARVARSLAGVDGLEVVGIDVAPPRHDLGAVRFVRADLRSPLLARTLAEVMPETVVHAAVSDDLSETEGKELNVLGSMQLLAACQERPEIRHLVAVSSGAVYGSSAVEPGRFSEDVRLPTRGRSRLGRHAAEMEDYVRTFAAGRPEVTTAVLRFADVLGAGVDSGLSRYISLPVVPKPMGFDARLQFLHPVDAVDACRAAVTQRWSGTFNVAASDVISLTQAVRILGRPSVGVPAAALPAAIELAGRGRMGPERMGSGELRSVTYGRVMDVSRIEGQGFVAHYSSRRVVQEFAALGTPGPLSSVTIDRLMRALDRLGNTAERFVRGGRRD